MIADKWIESAAPQLGGCPLINMQAEWLNTAREFYTRTTCWRQELAPISIIADTDTYTLVSGVTGADINLVHQISIPNRVLAPSANIPVVLGAQTSQTPTQYSSPEPQIVKLWPSPTENIDFMVPIVSLYPTSFDTTVMPEYLQNQFFEPLLDGMLGRLMNFKNKPFSNPEGAKYHLARFRSGMTQVRAVAIHGLNESENTWRFPRGFARGRMYL
jgi:hypothetical protein